MKMHPTKFTISLILFIVEVMLLTASTAGSRRVLSQPKSLEHYSSEFADLECKPNHNDRVRVLPLDCEYIATQKLSWSHNSRVRSPIFRDLALQKSINPSPSPSPFAAPPHLPPPRRKPPFLPPPRSKTSAGTRLVIGLLITVVLLVFVGFMVGLLVHRRTVPRVRCSEQCARRTLYLVAAALASVSALIVHAATFLRYVLRAFLPCRPKRPSRRPTETNGIEVTGTAAAV